MTLTFKRYPSLANHYVVGKARRIMKLYEGDWYGTEKIHGSNGSVVMDADGDWGVAKRSGFIKEDDTQFLNMASYIPKGILDAMRTMLEDNPSWDRVHVFGEYFGSGVQAMEYEVNMEGTKDFKAFNVFAHESGEAEDTYWVMGLAEMQEYILLEHFAPLEVFGSLKDFLECEPPEDSTLGGPREGRVYQPVVGYYIDDDKKQFLGVKHKNESFSETKQQGNKLKKKKENMFTAEQHEVATEMGDYITRNRLVNVLSHGEVELIPQNIGEIMNLLKEDVIKEYSAETDRELSPTLGLTGLLNRYSRDIAVLIKEEIARESQHVLDTAKK